MELQLKGFLVQTTVCESVFPGSAAKHPEATEAGVQEGPCISPEGRKTYQGCQCCMLCRHAKMQEL